MKQVTRRHVVATLSASTVLMCPAILSAQDASFDWGEDVPTDVPRNEAQMITLGDGETEVDVTALEPGDVAVVAVPTDDEEYSETQMTQFIGIMRRTDDQIAFAQTNDRPDTVQDIRYFVANLVCPHRGNAIGMTGNPEIPFACTKRGSRHDGVFNAVGLGVTGGPEGDYMSIPAYQLAVTEADGVISQAVFQLV